MKKYTEEEKNTLYITAKKELATFSETKLNDYVGFLESLESKPYNSESKTRLALDELQKLENEISNFIFINYPKIDEIFENGLVYYTVETYIHINLFIESYKTHKKLYSYYINFSKISTKKTTISIKK